MITGELKSKVDSVWNAFWTGGISNPLEVIEQITYLLFIKRLDDLQTKKELQATILNQPIKEPILTENQKDMRWSRFSESRTEIDV